MGYCSEAVAARDCVSRSRVSSIADAVNQKNSLQVTSLSYSYAGGKAPVKALNNLDFTIQEGGFYALLGPNGAGKSTLFALLTRLFVAKNGGIKLFGKDLSKASHDVLGDIGVVFQSPTLDLDLTVEQNLLYHGALHGLSPKTVRQRMIGELAGFNLDSRLKDKVRELNGGHRRRLELVRALLHRPRLLLLDEPTAGLDLESRRYLGGRVRQLCRDRGLSVLWATHLLEEIGREDHLLVIHRGLLKAHGQCDKLCKELGVSDVGTLFDRLTGDSR